MSGCELEVRVAPRSRRAGIECRQGKIVVRVRAAPEHGEANEEVLDLLARALGVSPLAFRIVAGTHSRRKRIRLEGWTREAAIARLCPEGGNFGEHP